MPISGHRERFSDRRLPRPPFVLADQAHILPETSALSTTEFYSFKANCDRIGDGILSTAVFRGAAPDLSRPDCDVLQLVLGDCSDLGSGGKGAGLPRPLALGNDLGERKARTIQGVAHRGDEAPDVEHRTRPRRLRLLTRREYHGNEVIKNL